MIDKKVDQILAERLPELKNDVQKIMEKLTAEKQTGDKKANFEKSPVVIRPASFKITNRWISEIKIQTSERMSCGTLNIKPQ